MVVSVADIAPAGASSNGTIASGSILGKDQFLQLLVAQLQNQDPLKPLDPTEFTAQLAQFSSLEQLFSANESLSRMVQASRDNQELGRLSAVGLIGRRVEVAGADFHYRDTPVEFGYTLDAPAAAVRARILDSSGQVVAVLPQDQTGPGRHYSSWDGDGLAGRSLPPGDYRLQVERVDRESATAVPTRIRGVVAGVDLDSQGSILATSAGEFGLAEVVSVTD
ncbi:MAG: flagellar hook assembly protein FlgD [Desulfobacterales bacterium]|nr:flagellar hook assembly protein FlgD [Desulfobacterales bacterium]